LKTGAVTPGPGHYEHFVFNKPKCVWSPIPVMCFYKVCETCMICKKDLFGDYYKTRRGDRTWCYPCYQKIEREEFPAQKVRHCFFWHKHIGLENITHHKTTMKRVKALERQEKIMRIKFGEMLDSKNRPIH